MISRRTLLELFPISLLAACSNPAITPAEVVQTAQNVANALATALPQIALLPAVAKDPKAVANIAAVEGDVSKAQTTLAALAGSLPDAKSGASTLSQVWGWLNTAVTTAEAVPNVPDNIRTYIVSAGIGLPIVEAFVNQTLGTKLQSTAVAKPG